MANPIMIMNQQQHNHFISWLSAIPDLISSLLNKLGEEAFPSETRGDWLVDIAKAVAAVAAALLFLWFCLPIMLSLLFWLAVILKWVVMVPLITCKWVVTGLWVTCKWIVWVTCKVVYLLCGSGSDNSVRMMMIAPGTGGDLHIARAAFEAAPKAYFAALRAGSLVLSTA